MSILNILSKGLDFRKIANSPQYTMTWGAANKNLELGTQFE